MSKVLEVLETERLLAIKEELTSTNYNQLKSKLAELGAVEAWQQGEKKEIIIAKALQIIEGSKKDLESNLDVSDTVKTEVQDKEEKTFVDPVINSEIEVIKDISSKELPVVEVKKKEVEVISYNEDDPRNYVSELTQNVSLEDLEKNLARIQLLMKGSNNFHKMILLEKSKQIEEKIKELIKNAKA